MGWLPQIIRAVHSQFGALGPWGSAPNPAGYAYPDPHFWVGYCWGGYYSNNLKIGCCRKTGGPACPCIPNPQYFEILQ